MVGIVKTIFFLFFLYRFSGGHVEIDNIVVFKEFTILAFIFMVVVAAEFVTLTITECNLPEMVDAGALFRLQGAFTISQTLLCSLTPT